MSAGRLVETGRPVELLEDPLSHFHALCQAVSVQIQPLSSTKCPDTVFVGWTAGV